MATFKDYLDEVGVEEDLKSVLMAMEVSVKRISAVVRVSNADKAGTENSFGEEQLALDVQSDKIVQEEAKKCDVIGLLGSEELPDEMKIGDGEFAVAYDPLDGSSLVDVNLAVGTIIGIYKTKTFIGVKGDDQVASMIVTYGPRTSMLLTVRKGVVEFVMDGEGEFVLTNRDLKVGDGKMFAPGNLRATSKRKDYLDLLVYWSTEQYKLRYSGGMVPDINQIILKGKGIFSYPGYEDQPDGKLRLLFECAPIALLMEQAGGAASDGKMRLLDKVCENIEQRTPIFVGGKTEVERCEKMLQ